MINDIAAKLREQIFNALPAGSVIPRHTDTGHFYEVPRIGKTYGSVTGKLAVLKDEGLMNYKMNRAIDYVFGNFKKFNDDNILEHLEEASKASGKILVDAGDIGTDIHEYRERYYSDWIRTGVRPPDIQTYITPGKHDIRAVSALAALEKFVIDNHYVPIVTELLVYDEEFALAGTLDDIGLMREEIVPPKPDCDHSLIFNPKTMIGHCLKCEYKYKMILVLKDLKTSNQFKDHYFFQVALYYRMFKKLTGLKPKKSFILKISKTDRTYKIEELYNINRLVQYSKHMLKTNEALDYIKGLRKDNQKVVLTL